MSMLQTLLDPERRKKAAEDQAKLRATMGQHVARNPAQANYLYGLARERMALDQLGALSDFTDLSDTHVEHLRAQLAEGLAFQGQFDKALGIASDTDKRRATYAAKQAAIERVGEIICGHPLTRRNADDLEESLHVLIQKVWNGKVEIVFTRCLECNTISANA